MIKRIGLPSKRCFRVCTVCVCSRAEPLANGRNDARQQTLDVLDIVQFGRPTVLLVDDDNLPVRLVCFVDTRQKTKNKKGLVSRAQGVRYQTKPHALPTGDTDHILKTKKRNNQPGGGKHARNRHAKA